MKTFLSLLSALLLASCVHLTQEQCLSTDWASIGMTDGTQGASPRNLSSATSDCAKFGIKVNEEKYLYGWKMGMRSYCTPDNNLGMMDGSAGKPKDLILSRSSICAQAGLNLKLSHYDAGYVEGLKSYCTFDNGVIIARSGNDLPQVCPSHLKGAFLKGWKKSRDSLCNDISNAFNLGKSNATYPGICVASIYPAFKGEYDRGITIAQRSGYLESKLNEVNNTISNTASRFGLIFNGQIYLLGHNQSPEAQNAMAQVNNLLIQKQALEKEIFETKVIR